MSSSLKTKFLNLHKWIGTDSLKRDEIVDNFDKIDKAAEATTSQLEQIPYEPKISINQFKIRTSDGYTKSDTILLFENVHQVFSHRYKTTGTIYALERYIKNTNVSQKIYKSYDGGTTWFVLGELALNSGEQYTHIYVTGETYTILLIKDANGTNYVESYDSRLNKISELNIGKKTWLSSYHNVDSKYVSGVGEIIYFSEYCMSNDVTELNIWKSSDSGKNWTVVFNIPFGDNSESIRHFHTCQIDTYSNDVWISSGDSDLQSKIWRSQDNGVTWQLLGGGRKGDNQLFRNCGFLFEENEIYYGMDCPMKEIDTFLIKINRSDLTRVLGENERFLDKIEKIGKQTDGHAIYSLTRTFYPAGFVVFSVSEPNSLQTDRFIIQFYSFATKKLQDIAIIPGFGKTNNVYNGFSSANRYADMLTGNIYVSVANWITATNLSLSNNVDVVSKIFLINLS